MKGRIPAKSVVVGVSQNSVDLANDRHALLLLKFAIVNREQCVDALIFEAREVVVVRHVRQSRVPLGFRIRKDQSSPSHVSHVEATLHHKREEGFRRHEPEIEADTNLSQVLLINREPWLRLFIW